MNLQKTDMMIFASTLEAFDHDIHAYHFSVPEEVAMHLLKCSGSEVECHLEGDFNFNGQIRKSLSDQYYVPMGADKVNRYGLRDGQLLFVELRPAQGLLGLDMSEALQVALQQNPQAHRVFYEMTPGNRHSVVYFVDHFHDEHARPSKALSALRHIVANDGNIDFKALLSETNAESTRGSLGTM